MAVIVINSFGFGPPPGPTVFTVTDNLSDGSFAPYAGDYWDTGLNTDESGADIYTNGTTYWHKGPYQVANGFYPTSFVETGPAYISNGDCATGSRSIEPYPSGSAVGSSATA
jgi:hypothetical protein